MSAQVINRSEFERLYAQYHPRFVVIAQRYVRDAMVAEDLVTDSFVSFWKNRERFDGGTNPAAYLLTIVKNKRLIGSMPSSCTCGSRNSCRCNNIGWLQPTSSPSKPTI